MRIYDTSYLVECIISSKEPHGAILDLTLYEITNVVRKAIEKGEISEEDGQALLQYINTLDLRTISIHTEDLQDILRIAKKYGLSAYDAAYLYFTVREGGELMTADRKLDRTYKNIKKRGYV